MKRHQWSVYGCWCWCVLLVLGVAGCRSEAVAETPHILGSVLLKDSAAYPADLKLASDDAVVLASISAEDRRLSVRRLDRSAASQSLALERTQTEFSFSLALNQLAEPAIAYVAEPEQDLVYAESRDGHWMTEIVDAEGAVGYFVSLAFDRDGQPHMSYFDQTNNDLKYAQRTSRGWRIETIDASGQPGFHIPAGFTRLALGCAATLPDCRQEQPGIAYLAYRYKPYDGELRYATRDEHGWQIETIDDTRGAGGFPALVLDDQAQPWISYYRLSTWDFSLGELRLARRTAGRWQVEVLDQGEYVGRYNALALTPDQRPVLAYYGAPSGALHLAWWDEQWHRTAVQNSCATAVWITLAIDRRGIAHATCADMQAGATRYTTMTIPN